MVIDSRLQRIEISSLFKCSNVKLKKKNIFAVYRILALYYFWYIYTARAASPFFTPSTNWPWSSYLRSKEYTNLIWRTFLGKHNYVRSVESAGIFCLTVPKAVELCEITSIQYRFYTGSYLLSVRLIPVTSNLDTLTEIKPRRQCWTKWTWN